MKKYIKHILLFAIPILLVSVPLDFWFSGQLAKSKSLAQGEIEVWNDIYSSNLNSEVLIYGSSRGWNHFDPHVLEQKFKQPIYNVGIDGYGFEMQHFRHLEILKHNKAPQTIIYSLDVFMFENQVNTYNSSQFLPFMFGSLDWHNELKQYEGFGWTDFYFPLLRYSGLKVELNEIAHQALSPDTESNRIKGFKAIDKEWSNDLNEARAKFKNGITAKIDSNLVQLFDQFLAQCQEQQIQLIFVFSPEYIEGQEFVKNRHEVFQVFKEMSGKYNLPYLDFSKTEICQDKNMFFNANHLNKKGVAKFNELLLDYLPK